MAPSQPQQKVAKINGAQLAYLDWGNASAQPLVLLHGMTSAAHVWDHLAVDLASSYRVLALDQRGHGDSEWTKEYSEADYVADLRGFIEQLELDKVILLGLSMGARVATQYAASRPAQLDRVICIEGPIWAQGEIEATAKWLASMRDFAVDSREELLAKMMAGNPRIVKEVIGNYLNHGMKQTAEGKWTWKYDRELRGGTAGDRLFADLAREPWDEWKKIKNPVLLVRGKESDSTPAPVMDRLAAENPTAKLVTVENAGHTLHVEQPNELRRIVREWLSGR
jgi:pimeloyl-ACP methyl ester carboxylesterase